MGAQQAVARPHVPMATTGNTALVRNRNALTRTDSRTIARTGDAARLRITEAADTVRYAMFEAARLDRARVFLAEGDPALNAALVELEIIGLSVIGNIIHDSFQ